MNINEAKNRREAPISIALFPRCDWEGETRYGTLDLEASLRYCLIKAERHYENFPVATKLLGEERRKAAAAIYSFSRAADDFADEPEYEGFRLAHLDKWRKLLDACYDGDAPSHPVFIALKWASERFDLPREEFQALLSAFRQDCEKLRYDSFDEVVDYCKRSANPVGRLMLRLFGKYDFESARLSDEICTGLQLANFWQDVSVDAQKNRIYVPLEDMERFGVSEKEILAGSSTSNFKELMEFQIERTQGFFERGRPLISRAGFPWALYLGLVWLGGVTISSLAMNDAASLSFKRPAITAQTALGLFIKRALGQ